jgi:hypothetical protein
MPVIEDRGPPLREEEVVAFETWLGSRLPADYREFLLLYNGGYPVPSAFRFASGAPGSVVQPPSADLCDSTDPWSPHRHAGLLTPGRRVISGQKDHVYSTSAAPVKVQ